MKCKMTFEVQKIILRTINSHEINTKTLLGMNKILSNGALILVCFINKVSMISTLVVFPFLSFLLLVNGLRTRYRESQANWCRQIVVLSRELSDPSTFLPASIDSSQSSKTNLWESYLISRNICATLPVFTLGNAIICYMTQEKTWSMVSSLPFKKADYYEKRKWCKSSELFSL